MTSFAHASDLDVMSTDSIGGRVVLQGTAAAMGEAFGVELLRSGARREHRGHSGAIRVPSGLRDAVTGVFGLNDRPIVPRHPPTLPSGGRRESLDVDTVAAHYLFPNATGRRQRVGLIELGGGYRRDDIERFCEPSAAPRIVDVIVGSSGNAPEPVEDVSGLVRWMNDVAAGRPPTAPPPERGRSTYEVTMDIELVAAFAPDAEIVVSPDVPRRRGCRSRHAKLGATPSISGRRHRRAGTLPTPGRRPRACR